MTEWHRLVLPLLLTTELDPCGRESQDLLSENRQLGAIGLELELELDWTAKPGRAEYNTYLLANVWFY